MACQGQPELSVAEWLVSRGWLSAEDHQALEYLVVRLSAASPGEADGLQTSVFSGRERAAETIVLPAPLAARWIDDLPIGGQAPSTDATSADDKSPRYRKESLHAEGGIGRVWRAWDEQLEREVALKELRPEIARNRTLVDRFLREARLTGQLEHPGVVPVHELCPARDGQGPFYAMRFLQGQTLKQAIEKYHRDRGDEEADALALVNLLAAFVATCNTLAYAHSHGIIHRDLKGENVLLGDFGEVVVADWGLAKAVGAAEPETNESGSVAPHETNSGLTMQGQVVGTPAYMSPEQASGRLELVDHRTDVYGLGAILYEILTGQPPFTGSKTIEVLLAAQRGDLVPPGRIAKNVPEVLEAICLRALAREREARYASASELAREVQGWQESQRQAAEAEVRASRERFKLAVEGSQDGLWDWDLKTDDVYFSPRWKSILGFEDHEIANRIEEWVARLHPDERERVLAANYAHIHGTTQHYEYEYRLRHKVGSYRWILARGVALRDENGKAYRMAGSHVDVTERRETEQRLRDIEQLHRVVMELTSLPLVVIDREGLIQVANPAGRRLLNFGPEDSALAISRTLLVHAIGADGAEFSEHLHPLTAPFRGDGGSDEFSLGLPRADGSRVWTTVAVRTLIRPDDSLPYAVVATFRERPS
ncbi:MAG: protein kinase domain-containing protein [Planctomycetaceae bacterium]